MKHGSAFTAIVIERCIDNDNLPELIRNKIDNGAVPYKSENTFHKFFNIAKKHNRNFLK